MRKNVIFITLMLFSLSATLFGQTKQDTYSKVRIWSAVTGTGNMVTSGEFRTSISLEKIKNGYHICIQRNMTPFGEVLKFETDAFLKNGIYIFACFDNWANHAFGFFRFDENACVLFLDCKDFSENGKNIGRLYGNSERLEKGSITF